MTSTRALAFALALLAGCISAPTTTVPTGGTWTPDCDPQGPRASAQMCMVQASTTPGSKIETWLSVNPANPRNVVVAAKDLDPAKSNGCVWNWYGVTHDAGATWTQVTIGGDFATRPPQSPLFGYACNTDPKHAFAPDGRLHAIVELYGLGASPSTVAAAGTRILLATSEDGGLTWPALTNLWESDAHTSAPDYPSIAVSPTSGTVVATFLDFFASGRCYVLSSRDQGRTADAPVLLATPRRGCVALEASPDGAFVLATIGPYDGAAPAIATGLGIRFEDVAFWQSTDDGRTFSPAGGFLLKSGLYDPSGNPHDVGVGFELAYDRSDGPERGRLYAAYHDDQQGTFNVLVRSSRDDGRTWSEPVEVRPAIAGLDRFMPNLVVSADGSVHVFFFDESWADDGTRVDLAHAVSRDAGATWTVLKLTSQAYDLGRGRHQNGGPDAGEYIGVDASGMDVWVAVPEASASETTLVAVARLTRA